MYYNNEMWMFEMGIGEANVSNYYPTMQNLNSAQIITMVHESDNQK